MSILRPQNAVTLRAIRPNAGTEARMRRQIQALIKDMHASTMKWLPAAYRANEPAIAQDELPAETLRRAVRRLTRQWDRNFKSAAERMAEYFALSVQRRTSQQLQSILRDGGFTINFRMTREMQDIMRATISEQVGLIRSIPATYFRGIEGAVMRSVQAGRDLYTLRRELQDIYGSTYKRAALIARDQNNKATASMTRARQLEVGIKQAVWVHSTAGKVPRPSHLRNDGKIFDLAKGWYDPDEGEYILPGQLINCRCVAKPVIRGFS